MVTNLVSVVCSHPFWFMWGYGMITRFGTCRKQYYNEIIIKRYINIRVYMEVS